MYLVLGDELLERLGSEWLDSSVHGLPVGQARSPVLVLAWVGNGPGWGSGGWLCRSRSWCGWACWWCQPVSYGVVAPVGALCCWLSPLWCPRVGVVLEDLEGLGGLHDAKGQGWDENFLVLSVGVP